MTDGAGLLLFVAPTGSRFWRYRYRFGGKEKLLSFRPYPEVKLAGARGLRDKARKVLADGKDPAVKETLHAPGGETFEAVAKEWLKAQDWKNSHGYERPQIEITADDFGDLPELPGNPPPKPSRLTFLSPADSKAAPSRGYLIKGLFAPGDVGCIFGAPGAGKSLIAPFLGYAVAQGREAFGMRTRAGGVFYVAAEDPTGMRSRVRALDTAHGDAPAFKLAPPSCMASSWPASAGSGAKTPRPSGTMLQALWPPGGSGGGGKSLPSE